MITISTSQVKKYGAIALLTTLLILSGVIGFNAIVDPYGMYRLVNIEGFNRHKPAIYNRVRLAKAYEVRHFKPRTVILGTSRTHLGIRPSHPAWPADGLPVYNLAFDGATTKEMYAYLRHAQAVRPLRRVLLGLDTYHLTDAPGAVRPGFDPQLLFTDRSWWSRSRVFLAGLKLLISYDTLSESIATLRAQRLNLPEWFAADGQRLGEIFFHEFEDHYRTLGPRGYFEEIDEQEVRYKLEWRIPTKSEHNAKQSPDALPDPVTSLDYIQRIIAFCRAHDIALILYITPAHAHQLEIAVVTGEWPAIENGKRALVKMLADDASKHPDRSPIPLYDFSSYNSITTEDLPPPGSREEMKYYWESSHFKEVVGDLVLNRILNAGRAPKDFGIRLDSSTIEPALAGIRAQQQAYRASHAEDIARIQHEIADYKQLHGIRD